MSAHNVAPLAAGRELDMTIAERVMGWVRGGRFANGNGAWFVNGEIGPTWDQTPRYSSDIAAAFQVVEEMRELGYAIELHYEFGCSNQWVADFVCADEFTGEQLGDTAPLAICRAALQVVEATHA